MLKVHVWHFPSCFALCMKEKQCMTTNYNRTQVRLMKTVLE